MQLTYCFIPFIFDGFMLVTISRFSNNFVNIFWMANKCGVSADWFWTHAYEIKTNNTKKKHIQLESHASGTH